MTTFTRQFDLYLGRAIGKIGFVDSADFDSFLKATVTPRFPGFTLIDTVGAWEGAREETTVLRILGTDSDHDAIRDVAEAYKVFFSQSAVLVVRLAVLGELV